MMGLNNRQHLLLFIGLITIYLIAGNVLLWQSLYINKLMSKASLYGLSTDIALNREVEFKQNYNIVHDACVNELIKQEEGEVGVIYSNNHELQNIPKWYRMFVHLCWSKVPYLDTEGKHYATKNAIYYVSKRECEIVWKRTIAISDVVAKPGSAPVGENSDKHNGFDFGDYSKANQIQEMISLNKDEKRKRAVNAVSIIIQLSGLILSGLFACYITVRTKSIVKGGMYSYTFLVAGSFMYYIWIPGALSYSGYKVFSDFFYSDEPVIVGVIGIGWVFTFLTAFATRGVGILFCIHKLRGAIGDKS